MTRTVSSTISTAVAEDVTQPVYLIEMGWDVASPDVNRYIATWDQAITWNSITWAASGADIRSLDASGGSLRLPNGDADPWLSLVNTQVPRGRAITIYEYHTNRATSPHTSDATLLFSGLMDDAEVTTKGITIGMIEGLQNKAFPIGAIDSSVFTNLLASGQRLYWGPDLVLVE